MKPETICIQAGYSPKNGEPRVMPIYQSTTYKYDSAQTLGELFDLKKEGHMYSRISNPSVAFVEEKVAMLEGGIGAMMTSSGQAAILISILNLCSAGDNFVCSSAIYGGTVNLFSVTLKRMGIECRYILPEASREEIESQIDSRTKLVYGETLTNPSLDVLDIERFAQAAHAHNIPLIIDNTFPTPILCRPFQFGADIVIHSTTKYMDGHATVVGGMIVDSGNFDWTRGDFPGLNQPDESYHGVTYTKDFGSAAFITKARVQLMRDLGSTPQAMSAFILNLGLETLALRMERHSYNALKVAEFLESNDKISWVNYPGLKSSKNYALAQKYLPNGCSGVVSFGVKGGREAAMKFMNQLQLAAIVTHVADARTCVIHPASTTHRQLTEQQLIDAGVSPDLIRFSVGIENIEDIIADIEQALS
ncbi:MAG: O-acetylhomoserine aminocarboxypropyltransferase/cysteine synthase [Christensenellaceae bacterium]|jgi:O-acetylhomoserine aminocarboxypropyltransferase/cysteine synthase|nr:O-acetylhomoserine aminocarboxypropyltransferase/cysteine synthase [Christensenellaceae bacterium]MBS6564802.1 O-acetylhomoserine aminocarboxypropyltransferase/cysteine synthase [Clostridiales bacterium]PWM00969.1 MAG: O-acetylhomoserine aminocarboxypropyltransferase [Selenomonadales bacterium]